VSNFSKSRVAHGATALAVCLGFTGSGVAWADDAHSGPPRPDLYIEDPYAPHDTNGSEARVGTLVGFVYGEPQTVLALGVTAAGGYRFGRLTIESEFSAFQLETHGTVMTSLGPADGDMKIGHGERLGVIARFDVIRLDSRVVGPNSLLSIYVEGGGATAWNTWARPTSDQPPRIVPDDTKRVEGQVGFGLALDHRLQEPIGFPRRIAWFLGWRLALAPHQAMLGSECRGITCRSVVMADASSSYVDSSMLFQSSLAFTF
jgi:hypothetical protein